MAAGFFFEPPGRVVEIVVLRPSAAFARIIAVGRNDALAIGVADAAFGQPAVSRFSGMAGAGGGSTSRFAGFMPVSVSVKGNSGAWVLGYVPALAPRSIDSSLASALVLKAGHWRCHPAASGAAPQLGDVR